MRRLAVIIVILAGCKSMSGFEKVAGGFGKVAATAAAGIGHVAAPIAKAAPIIAHAAAKAAPVVLDAASLAVQVGEPVAEAVIASQLELEAPGYVEDAPLPPDHDTQDLCLDCPDAGNCNSCLEPR